jgi:hypothetical protein
MNVGVVNSLASVLSDVDPDVKSIGLQCGFQSLFFSYQQAPTAN